MLKWQEIKPKPGAMWPSGRSGFQLFVYQDDVSTILIPLYEANFCFKFYSYAFVYQYCQIFTYVPFHHYD